MSAPSKRAAYEKRRLAALRDGGRIPGQDEWAEVLRSARVVAKRSIARLMSVGEPSVDHTVRHDLVLLEPGHVGVRAETLLGIEVELSDVLASREAVDEHRMQLLNLVAKAAADPGCVGDVDIFALEDGLLGVRGMPKDATAQLLEVVRELIRWRAAAKAGDR